MAPLFEQIVAGHSTIVATESPGGMVTEPAETYEAATRRRRSTGPLLLICLVVGSIAIGGAAGALGLLAPIHDLVSAREAAETTPDPVFYALPEFRIAIGPPADDRTASAPASGRHLRAIVQLEVEEARMPHVEALQPRIIDALLTFLHALDQRDVGSARSLDRLKAQMLHRVRQVAGDDSVHAVLITEFALL
jgi:flagellar basal body-associated protein FliL